MLTLKWFRKKLHVHMTKEEKVDAAEHQSEWGKEGYLPEGTSNHGKETQSKTDSMEGKIQNCKNINTLQSLEKKTRTI